MSQRRNEFTRNLRKDTVDTLLEEDSRILTKLFDNIRRRNILPSSIYKTYDCVGETCVLSWWHQNNNNIPESFSFLRRHLEKGGQPIFCNISYYSASSAQTIYVPAPYAEACKGYEGFKNTVWLNGPDESPADSGHDWENTARQYSHACANISYSVRFGDAPIVGWLARAHKIHEERLPLYLPDVRKARFGSNHGEKIFSAAKNDEPFLGMASALYIPLVNSHYLDSITPPIQPNPKEDYAIATLMLWSPVVRRWDHIVEGQKPKYEDAEVYTVNDISIGNISKELHWIEDVSKRDSANQKWREADYLGLIHSFDKYFKDSSDKEAVKKFSHGLTQLLSVLENPGDYEGYSVIEWIEWFFNDRNGFWNTIISENLTGDYYTNIDNCNVIIMDMGDIVQDVTPVEISKDSIRLDKSLRINIDEGSAKEISQEPSNNVAKYSQGINRIEVILSATSLTLRIMEDRTQHSGQGLAGSREKFKRYYASRRGIPVPAVSGSALQGHGGMGLALYSAIAAQLGVFRRLYISPDGSKKCYTSVSMPLKRTQSP